MSRPTYTSTLLSSSTHVQNDAGTARMIMVNIVLFGASAHKDEINHWHFGLSIALAELCQCVSATVCQPSFVRTGAHEAALILAHPPGLNVTDCDSRVT